MKIYRFLKQMVYMFTSVVLIVKQNKCTELKHDGVSAMNGKTVVH
jgi:hypothetical protein